jgi:hypothetical protein
MGAAWGVHAYDAPKVQWLLMFPGVFFGSVALGIQAVQWVGYAFLLISIRRQSNRRPYVVTLACAVAIHLIGGLATVGAV